MIERERACDNIVLKQNIKPSRYAEHLLKTSEELGTDQKTAWAFAGMAEGTDFKDRMLSILDPNARRTSLSLARFFLTVTLSALILVPLAAFSPWTLSSASTENYSVPPVYDQGKIPVQAGESGRDLEELEKLFSALTSNSPGIKEKAATILGKMRDIRAVPALINALKDSNARVREHVASALGELRDIQAVPALINTLKDSNARVREHVATALGRLRDKRAYDQILDTLLNDESLKVREHALQALAQLGDKRAYQQILDIIHKSTNLKLRTEAVAALGKTGDDRALPVLLQFLSDPVENVRLHAVHGLASLGNKKALPALHRLADDASEDLRRAVKMAIDKIRKQ